MKILALFTLSNLLFFLSWCNTQFHDSPVGNNGKILTTIAFGSCNKPDAPQPLWSPIVSNKPELWIWLGDNIYGDTDDMAVMMGKYEAQRSNPEYKKLTISTPVIGIWDDHDYGRNDGGKGYEKKAESQKLMLDFLGEHAHSERRIRKGSYGSYTYGPKEKQVKVILLDGRYFRDTIFKHNNAYVPNHGTLLGDEQWKWLEMELNNSKAAINLIGCGIQMIPEEHNYEKWANFPEERKKLFDLIAKSKVKGAMLLSGDRHIAEISKFQHPDMSYPLVEVTASGLTHSSINNVSEANQFRDGKLINVLNFGLLTIDWNQKPLKVTVQLKGENDKLLEEKVYSY